jgi:hypothetical protein
MQTLTSMFALLSKLVEDNTEPLLAVSMFGFVFLSVLTIINAAQSRVTIRKRTVAYNPANSGSPRSDTQPIPVLAARRTSRMFRAAICGRARTWCQQRKAHHQSPRRAHSCGLQERRGRLLLHRAHHARLLIGLLVSDTQGFMPSLSATAVVGSYLQAPCRWRCRHFTYAAGIGSCINSAYSASRRF